MKSSYKFFEDGTGVGSEWNPVYIWSDCNPTWNLVYESRENINEFEFNWTYEPINEKNDNSGYLTIGNWVGLIEFNSDSEFEIIEDGGLKWLIPFMYYSEDDPNTGLENIKTESFNNESPPEDYSSNRMLEVTTTFRKK
jgi:hypothetical protein